MAKKFADVFETEFVAKLDKKLNLTHYAMNPKGVTIRPSKYSVKDTIDRLQQFLQQHGMTIYTRIDQQKEVNGTGQNIAPLEFILFGNPKVGGLAMTENPITALDLPLKVIAWEDKDKRVWLAYNAGSYILERYSLSAAIGSLLEIDPVIAKIL